MESHFGTTIRVCCLYCLCFASCCVRMWLICISKGWETLIYKIKNDICRCCPCFPVSTHNFPDLHIAVNHTQWNPIRKQAGTDWRGRRRRRRCGRSCNAQDTNCSRWEASTVYFRVHDLNNIQSTPPYCSMQGNDSLRNTTANNGEKLI